MINPEYIYQGKKIYSQTNIEIIGSDIVADTIETSTLNSARISINNININDTFSTHTLYLDNDKIESLTKANLSPYTADNDKIPSKGYVDEAINNIPPTDLSECVKNNIDQTLTNKFIMNNSNNELTANLITSNNITNTNLITTKDLNVSNNSTLNNLTSNNIINTQNITTNTLTSNNITNNNNITTDTLTSNNISSQDLTLTNNINYNNEFKNNRLLIINNYFSSTSDLSTINDYYLCISSNGNYTLNHIYKLTSLNPLETQEIPLEDFLLIYVIYDKRYLIYYNNNWMCINEGRFSIASIKMNSLIFNDYNTNINNGEYCNVFGLNNKITTASGKYILVNGSNNSITSNAQASLITGNTNNITSPTYASLISGSSNIIGTYMDNSIIGGYNNKNTTNNSSNTLFIGSSNTINGCYNSIIGGVNSNIIKSRYSLVSGGNHTSNTSDKNYNTILGQSNTINNSYCLMNGEGNISSNDYQTILGKYSDNTDTTNLFVIGNGTNNNNRSNALLLNNSGNLTINNLSYSNDYKNNRILIIDNYFDGNDTTPLINLNNYYLCISTTSPYTQNYIYKLTSLNPTTEEIIPEDFLIIYVNYDKRYLIYYNNNWVCINEGRTNINNIKNNSLIFNDYTNNVNLGEKCNVFGLNNQINTTSAKQMLVNGQNNIITSNPQNSIITGSGISVSSRSDGSLISGINNRINTYMLASIIGGSDNINNAPSQNILLIGSNNISSYCNNSIIGGNNNNITSSNSLICGANHTSDPTTKNYNTILGNNNTFNNSYLLMAGEGHISSNDYQTILGKYSDNTNTKNLFVVGNGTDDNNRSNAFSVQSNGTLNLRYINFNDKDNNRQFGFYVGIIGVYINTGSGYKLYNVEGSAILNESEETATLTTGTIYCEQAKDKWQYLREIVFTYNSYRYVLRPIQIKKNYCGTLCLSSSNWQCTDIYINSLIFETDTSYDNWFQKNFAVNTYPAYQFCGSRFAIYLKTPI